MNTYSTQPSEGAVRAAKRVYAQFMPAMNHKPEHTAELARIIDQETGVGELVAALRDAVSALEAIHDHAPGATSRAARIATARAILSRHTSTQGKEGKPAKPPPADIRRAFRLANELCAELQRVEHLEEDRCDGFDATDLLTDIRAARDHAVNARDTLENRMP